VVEPDAARLASKERERIMLTDAAKAEFAKLHERESHQRNSDRERAIKAIRRGVPLGEVVNCSCHTDPPTRNGCFGVCEDAVSAIIAVFDEVRNDWHPIGTMPTDDTLFLAATADGRMMIWRGDILAHSLRERTPHHLQFPATHWMPLPWPPPRRELSPV
jgi:hypothetical protein